MLGLASLGLFIYGNIILFSSLQTCRRSTPLLWWAVMTVTGVGWFLLFEVVFVVLVVGVVGPGILVSKAGCHGNSALPRLMIPERAVVYRSYSDALELSHLFQHRHYHSLCLPSQ
jgi:hypothetical protein